MNAPPVNDISSAEVDRLMSFFVNRNKYACVKRIFDLVVAMLFVLILSPLFIVLVLTVKFTSPGPVIFRQERIGQMEGHFQMLKFRSMYTEVTPEMAKVLLRYQEAGTLLKGEQDPRVTPVGKWLRRTSLDELPQLFNVIGGTMSLVGPRPLMLHLARPYPNFVKIRSMLKPGITGLWQIKERDNFTSAAYMIGHDLEYLENFCFINDIKILLLTLPALLSAKGAC